MSGKKGFDYSKWDSTSVGPRRRRFRAAPRPARRSRRLPRADIEISDDESDCHPNIDKDSWFRMKHRSRVEREDKEEQEKRNLVRAAAAVAARALARR